MLGALRHGLHTLTSAIASALGAKTFAQRVPVVVGTTEVTPGAVQVIEVDATMFPGAAGTIAIGGPASADDGGYEAVVSAGFAVLGTAVGSVADYLAVDSELINRVDIYAADTGEPVETALGEQVFGLLQAQAAVADGDAIAAAGVENLQISFVYLPRANPALNNMTLFALDAGVTYRMGFRRHRTLVNMPYSSMIVGGDPLPDVLTSVYYVPTFVGVVPGDYPPGSPLVAEDTQEIRIALAAAWHYVRGSYEQLAGAAGDYTVLDTDGYEVIEIDCGGANRTQTLPTAAANANRRITFIKADNSAFTSTVDGEGAELVGGVPSRVLRYLGDSVTVQCNGVSWSVVPVSLARPSYTDFVDRALSTIAFVDGTLTLTITPTGASFDFYIQDVLYTQVGADTVAITDTQGLWYIYYDNTGTLIASQTPWLEDGSQCIVGSVYWDASSNTGYGSLVDQRHSYLMSWQTRAWVNGARGLTQRETQGELVATWTEGDGSANADAQIGMTGGTIRDEDISVAIVDGALGTAFQQPLTLPAELPVWYRVTATPDRWAKLGATAYPFRYQGGTSRYNLDTAGTWSQTNVTDGFFFNALICAAPWSVEPLFAIQGQEEYATQAEAEAEEDTDYTLTGLSTTKVLYLYRLTYQTDSGYTNATDSRLVAVTRLSVDAPEGGVPIAPEHNGLIGRDVPMAHAAHALFCMPTTIDNADTVYAVTMEEDILLFDGSGGVIDSQLPPAAMYAGRGLEAKCIVGAAANCTFTPNGGETIDGAGGAWAFTFVNEAIRLLSDGTNWIIRP
jgi:hypothetical protein